MEKCVSRIIEPHGALVRPSAILLASLLRCSLTPHLPGTTMARLIAWLGEALGYQRRKGDQPDTVYQLLRALAATLRNTSNPAQEVRCILLNLAPNVCVFI